MALVRMVQKPSCGEQPKLWLLVGRGGRYVGRDLSKDSAPEEG